MRDLNFLNKQFNNNKFCDNLVNVEVFVVEDDDILGPSVVHYLRKKLNYTVTLYKDPSLFLEMVNERQGKENDLSLPDNAFCLVADISFDNGGADGLLLIDLLQKRDYNFFSLAMTGFASVDTAILATKKGVYHYLTKPFELDVLVSLIQRGVEEKIHKKKTLSNANAGITSTIVSSSDIDVPNRDDIFCGMIGRSKGMKEVFALIEKVSNSDTTVFINGQSGTGKELVAKAIHNLSSRSEKKLISINCGAIPADLLESELFGHEKGSFTGAISSRKGKFESAEQGTLFLDEIGDMPQILQVKLLRALQTKEIEPVGCEVSKKINVRIVTATHQNLDKMVQDGTFREDLFYRLNVIPITIPALKDRKEDIPLLISFFLSRFVSADGRNSIRFSKKAYETLLNYVWPGNVRELENLIERLVILKGGGIVDNSDLPDRLTTLDSPEHLSPSRNVPLALPFSGLNLKTYLDEIETSFLEQALERTSGNKNQASKLLGMNRTTLIEKLKKKKINYLSM